MRAHLCRTRLNIILGSLWSRIDIYSILIHPPFLVFVWKNSGMPEPEFFHVWKSIGVFSHPALVFATICIFTQMRILGHVSTFFIWSFHRNLLLNLKTEQPFYRLPCNLFAFFLYIPQICFQAPLRNLFVSFYYHSHFSGGLFSFQHQTMLLFLL